MNNDAGRYGLAANAPKGMVALAKALVDGWRWYNAPWGDPPNSVPALISDAAVDLWEELLKNGWTVVRTDDLIRARGGRVGAEPVLTNAIAGPSTATQRGVHR